MNILNSIIDFLSKMFESRTQTATPSIPSNPNPNPNPVPENPPSKPEITLLTKELIYQITSAFEGGVFGKINFSNLTGNFDDQGLSIGFLQWCTGQDSDRPLFVQMNNDHHDVLKSVLGTYYDSFVATLQLPTSQRLKWAIGINDSSNRIVPTWKAMLSQLCNTSEFQEIQMKFAESKLQKAVKYCDTYQVVSVRALALMFDIVTQNGSISEKTHNKIMSDRVAQEKQLGRKLTEREFLKIIATDRAEASNPQWINDVKLRKLCIVNGNGTVHGTFFDFDKLGLSDEPFLSKV